MNKIIGDRTKEIVIRKIFLIRWIKLQ